MFTFLMLLLLLQLALRLLSLERFLDERVGFAHADCWTRKVSQAPL